jgi:hypothetical protein
MSLSISVREVSAVLTLGGIACLIKSPRKTMLLIEVLPLSTATKPIEPSRIMSLAI